jgi:hypothetical protein
VTLTPTTPGTLPLQQTTAPVEEWLSGAGAPGSATGNYGDWYLDETSGDVYEKTTTTVWTLRANIKGPPGPTGPQGPIGSPGPPGAANSVYTGTWRWTSGLTDAATSGRVGLNATSWATATEVHLNKTTYAGSDVSIAIGKIKVGDDLYLQDKADANKWGRYTIAAAATDNGSWVSYPVTLVNASEPPPANNADANVSLLVEGAQVEEWLSGAGAPAGTTGNSGDWYLDTGTGDVYEKTAASTWTLRGNIKGPAGPAGPQGNVGPQGPPGVPGDTVVAAAARVLANMLAAGDAQPAWRVLGSGQMEWGAGGASAPDVILSRSAANRLQVTGEVRITRAGQFDPAQSYFATGDTAVRLQTFANGTMQWGPGNAGTDTTLQRGGVGQFNVGQTTQKGSLRIFGAAAADLLIDHRVTTDANARFYVRADGYHAWGDGTATQDVILSRFGANAFALGTSSVKAKFRVWGGAAADNAVETVVTTDPQLRWFVRADGQMQWGDGTNPQDVTLARSGAGILSLGSSTQKGRLRTYGSAAGDLVFDAAVTTDAFTRLYIRADGYMNWGDGTNANDAPLWRFAAGSLAIGTATTKGKLRTYGGVTTDTVLETLVTTDAQLRFYVRADGQQSWGPGNTAPDVNLYRNAADRLKTDDLFDATGLAVATKVKAGTPVDADWAAAPPDGTIVADSTALKLWFRTGGVWQSQAGAAGPTYTYGTTPPGSPANGDIWIFPADATNGIMWQFRYNAGSASAYKWEFVGGPTMVAVVATPETTTTSGSYVNLTTVGPTITVPRAGDYDVSISAQLQKSVADPNVQMAAGVGDFSGGPIVTAIAGFGGASYYHSPYRAARSTQAASTVLRAKYFQSAAGTLSVQDRLIALLPVRVS